MATPPAEFWGEFWDRVAGPDVVSRIRLTQDLRAAAEESSRTFLDRVMRGTFSSASDEPAVLTSEGLAEALRRMPDRPIPQIIVNNAVPPGCIYVVSNGAPVVRWTIDAGLDPANFGATIPEPEPEIDYDRIDGYTVEEMIEMYKKRGKRDE